MWVASSNGLVAQMEGSGRKTESASCQPPLPVRCTRLWSADVRLQLLLLRSVKSTSETLQGAPGFRLALPLHGPASLLLQHTDCHVGPPDRSCASQSDQSSL